MTWHTSFNHRYSIPRNYDSVNSSLKYFSLTITIIYIKRGHGGCRACTLPFLFPFREDCRLFRADGRIDAESLHQALELFPGYLSGFLGSPGPLEPAFRKPDVQEDKPVSGP